MNRKQRVDITTSGTHQTVAVRPESDTRRKCGKGNCNDEAATDADDTMLVESPIMTVASTTTGLSSDASERKSATCSSEKAARGAIEKRRGRAFTDKEWIEDRKRLVEFGLILKRWDSQQREGSGTAVESKPRQGTD